MKKPLTIAEQRELSVRKANEIIQKSRFSLSTQQQKIILYLISKIKPQDKEFEQYEFNIIEFCEVCGIDKTSGNNYAELKAAIKAIADKSMWIDKGDAKGTNALIRWIEMPEMETKTGIIRVRLNSALKPYLLELKQNYTSYELIWTLKFKSKYSIRLYELIKSLHYHELDAYEVEYSFEQLRQLLDSNYTQYKNFKQRVLLPAIAEINRYSDKTISIEEIKEGKAHSVKAIRLKIETKADLERLKLHVQIQEELGVDENQLTVWEILQEGANADL